MQSYIWLGAHLNIINLNRAIFISSLRYIALHFISILDTITKDNPGNKIEYMTEI